MKFIRRFRKIFTPKIHFQPIYTQQAAYIKQASSALLQMLESSDLVERKRLEKEVKLCEVQGDAMLTEFYEQLNENFVTPIDRAELQTMAMNIDEILDNINGSAKSILRYIPNKIDAQLIELARYIDSEANTLMQLVSYIDDLKSNYTSVILQCDRITELEHAADDAYEEYIGNIFQNEKDPIELMKNKNIAEMLESTTDSAKKVSDHVRKLLLRYIAD